MMDRKQQNDREGEAEAETEREGTEDWLSESMRKYTLKKNTLGMKE